MSNLRYSKNKQYVFDGTCPKCESDQVVQSLSLYDFEYPSMNCDDCGCRFQLEATYTVTEVDGEILKGEG